MMLTRLHKILIALLVVQIGLALVLLTRGENSVDKPRPLLANLDAAKVTKLAVFAKDATKPIELTKHGDQWVLSSSFDYPVTASKVRDLLGSLSKLSAPSPITTQASRHEQLRVADAGFERKLVLTAGGKDITIFVGTQAGGGRSAVRLGGDARVYMASGISAWSIGSEPRDWIDTSYVKVAKDDVAKVRIERAGSVVELERDGDHWKASLDNAPLVPAKDESLDTHAIERIVDEVSTIDLAAPADPKRDAAKPTATITITRKAQSTQSPAPIVVDVLADGEAYWVHDRASPRAGTVDKARLSTSLEITRDKLVTKPPPTTTAKPSKSPSSG